MEAKTEDISDLIEKRIRSILSCAVTPEEVPMLLNLIDALERAKRIEFGRY